MSNGDPPITEAPVPPSIAGIPQPVFASGDDATPATPIAITGSPIIPPPEIGNPVGVPEFPPTTGQAPVPVPVGPQVGPAISPAAVPPSVAGYPQPQFATGDATTPTADSLFPSFTTGAPSPPIVVPNIFQMGPVPPPLPTTPGVAPVQPSAVTTIPQLPWNPWPEFPSPPPVNTTPPTVTAASLEVGSTATSTPGVWTDTTSTAQQWLRDSAPIFGANGTSYTFVPADVGAMISLLETGIGPGGEASAESNEVGPVIAAPPADEPSRIVRSGSGTLPPRYAAPAHKPRKRGR